jgi:hypothetical protein
LFYIETLNAYSILCKILAKIGATDWNTKQADVLSRMIKEKVEISWKKEHSIFCLKKVPIFTFFIIEEHSIFCSKKINTLIEETYLYQISWSNMYELNEFFIQIVKVGWMS